MHLKRHSVAFIFGCFSSFLLTLSEGTAQSFQTLPEATQFLDNVIAAGDQTPLSTAMLQPEKSHFSENPAILETLVKEWRRTGTFTKLYKGHQFPPAGDSFTLGGHDAELGHLHLVFARQGSAWKLNDIWICR